MATMQVYSDSVQTQLNTEVAVIEIQGDVAPYAIVEGYIDLSQMPDGSTVVVREYIGLSSTPVLFLEAAIDSSIESRMIRFHSKALPVNGVYKVTVEQTAGSSFTVNYWFAKTGLT